MAPALTQTSSRSPGRNADQDSSPSPAGQGLLPLPWDLWPAEARLLISLVALWSIVGLLILTSASWFVADREMGDAAYYLKRQALWLLASWGLLLLAIHTSLRRWLHIAGTALVIASVLIAATLVIGSTVNGASRWLVLGPIQIQPTELVKPFVVLQGAVLFSHWRRIGNDQKLLWLHHQRWGHRCRASLWH